MSTYRIANERIKKNCIEEIQGLEVGYVVTIKKESESRSSAQHSLKWIWMRHIAKDKTGEGKGRDAEDWNRYFKGKFMRELLISQDQDYAEFYKDSDELILDARNKVFAKKRVLDSIKTEWLTVKNMAAFMDMITIHCSMDLGVSLPMPAQFEWLNDKGK